MRLIDSFQEGGWFLMVLELVGGGDLFTVLDLGAAYAELLNIVLHSFTV